MKEVKKLINIADNIIKIPSSKSYLNRALIIASCCKGKILLENIQDIGEDVESMIEILKKIGIKIEKSNNKSNNSLIVYGKGGVFKKPKDLLLNCGIGGTTNRFIIGLSILFDFDIEITGEGKMLERPIEDLINAINISNLKKIEYLKKDGFLPVKVLKSRNIINEISIHSSKSSQFLTSILMISPMIDLKSVLVKNLTSKSYVDITLDIMKKFNIEVINDNYKKFSIQCKKYRENISYFIEADWSCASYFLALEYLHNKKLNISGLNFDSVQGDKNFTKIIKSFKNNKEQILELDMSLMPDTSMTAMIIAVFENFNTKINGLKTLKDKECNRLIAMQNEFKKIGVKTEISQDFDSILIFGNSNFSIDNKIEIETYSDHRIAMCFAILASKTGNLIIKNEDVVKKSFPSFWVEFDSLYV